jgi:hypothetical protein
MECGGSSDNLLQLSRKGDKTAGKGKHNLGLTGIMNKALKSFKDARDFEPAIREWEA